MNTDESLMLLPLQRGGYRWGGVLILQRQKEYPPGPLRRRGSKQPWRSGHMESDKVLKVIGFGTLAIIVLGILLFLFKM
jgi:hypothetical protein